jgi:hypothetical protein
MAKKIQFNYTFTPGVNQTFNAYPNAWALLDVNREFVIKEATAYIASRVASATAPFINFNYDMAKCERDVGYVLDAYLSDLRYNGNEQIRKITSYYFTPAGVPLINGSRSPEIDVHTFLRNLINNNIFTNTLASAFQTGTAQTTLPAAAESGAASRITSLASVLLTTLTTGLSALPALVTSSGKYGTLEVQGNIAGRRLLLITNTTRGIILYNFVDATKSSDILYINSANTTLLTLKTNTTGHSSTDEIQLFAEEDYVAIQPTGTFSDPVDKMRVSMPQALIDTDFEYSLQGTKWENLQTVSNTPNIFIKANEPSFTSDQIASISVNTVTSIITVTTVGPHGRTPGQPVILKETVNEKFADGAFIILSTPTTTTFTFRGKAGVSVVPVAPANQPVFITVNAASLGATVLTVSAMSNGINAVNLTALVGRYITGTGIRSATFVQSVNTSANTITLSLAVASGFTTGYFRSTPYTWSEITVTSSDVGATTAASFDLGTYASVGGPITRSIQGQWDSTTDEDIYRFTLSDQAVVSVDSSSDTTNTSAESTGADSWLMELFSATGDGQVYNSPLTTQPAYLSTFSVATKTTLNTHFGFDGTGMWLTGDSGVPAYPIRTNFDIAQNVRVTIQFTFIWNEGCADHGICIFNTGSTPNWQWGADSSRIAFQYNCGGPSLYSRFSAATGGGSLNIGQTYTGVFVYDPNAFPNITVTTYNGVGTGGTTIGSAITFNELLPAGPYRIGFDADQDTQPTRSYFTAVTITTGSGAISTVNYGSVSPVNVFSSLTYGNNISATLNPGLYYVRMRLSATSGTVPDNYQLNLHLGMFSSTSLKTDSTAIYSGGFYTNSPIIGTITSISGTQTARCVCTTAHGFFYGTPIYVVDTTQLTANWVGAFSVLKIEDYYTFTFRTDAVSNYVSNAVLSTASTRIYTRSEGVALHRSLDGGVQINPGTNAVFARTIRQTRKYFRYQSGKGLQFNNGFLFKPAYNITTIAIAPDPAFPVTGQQLPTNFIITVTTDAEHGLAQPVDNVLIGAEVLIEGFTVNSGTNPYIGYVTITQVPSVKSFQYKVGPISTITDFAPGGIGTAYVTQWYDSVIRNGIYDDQNGMFFQCDGDDLACVRRFATTQLSGTVTVQPNSSVVTGNGTRFRSQLKVGDSVVLRGGTYLVLNIPDDGNILVSPKYGGTVASSTVKATRVEEISTERRNFSIDTVNSLGPSGYNLNLNKMQMAYIDYSWYGAGKIRYGFRTTDGNISYIHEYLGNNINNEAYMRSGNLPGRFEISNKPAVATLTSAFLSTATATFTVNVDNCSKFPPFGLVVINNEYMRYTRTNNTQLSIVQRNYPYGPSTPVDGRIGDAVISFNCNFSAALSHWGTAVIMDGSFDQDKSYLFTAANTNLVNFNNTLQERPIISIRLSPSADYGIPRDLGIRNLINRSAITLNSIGAYTRGTSYQITLRINSESPVLATQTNWRVVGQGSLAQFIDHSISGGTLTGGDTLFSFFVEEGTNKFSVTSQDINSIRDLGNSVLGGNQIYPDGPDILTVFATPLIQVPTLADVRCRITWTEAQG